MQKTINLKKKDAKNEINDSGDKENRRTTIEAENNNELPFPHKISWVGPLSNFQPDKKAIIIVSLILFAGAILVYVFWKSIINTIFLALLGVTLLMQIRQKPENGNISIDAEGIKIDDKLYPLKEIKSFWIAYETDGVRELSLKLNKWYMPYIKIPIGNQNPLHIRFLLLEFISEEEHEDTFVEIIGKRLGL